MVARQLSYFVVIFTFELSSVVIFIEMLEPVDLMIYQG